VEGLTFDRMTGCVLAERKKERIGANIGRFVDTMLKDEGVLNIFIFLREHKVSFENGGRENWQSKVSVK
jgi:hypothetical protein